MRLQEQDAPLGGLVSTEVDRTTHTAATFASAIRKTLVIAGLELRKLRHDPTELLTRAVQPALWLLIFGQVFTRARIISTGELRYIDFITPGILAQSVLFIAIFHGLAIIWERDLGILQKFLVSPTPRASLVLGKGLSAGMRAMVQSLFVYGIAMILGVQFSWAPLSLLGVVAAIFLGAVFFSTLSLIIACIVKTRERFMGMGQVITMPLFFASNAIYPTSLMPGWLRVISHMNPLTYQVDAMRALMVKGGNSALGLPLDYAVLVGATVIAVIVGAWIYPKVVM